MGDEDLIFYKKNKLYVADFTPWIKDGDLSQARQPLSLATIKSEINLTKKEKCNAKEAMEFVRNAGYPSEKEAIHMVRDGNIRDIPHDVQGVKDGFRHIGEPVESVRGKLTKKKIIKYNLFVENM